jgi:hypothetical protein
MQLQPYSNLQLQNYHRFQSNGLVTLGTSQAWSELVFKLDGNFDGATVVLGTYMIDHVLGFTSTPITDNYQVTATAGQESQLAIEITGGGANVDLYLSIHGLGTEATQQDYDDITNPSGKLGTLRLYNH